MYDVVMLGQPLWPPCRTMNGETQRPMTDEQEDGCDKRNIFGGRDHQLSRRCSAASPVGLGGFIGGGLSALRAVDLAARQAAMSFGMSNLMRNFAEMNPQFVTDAANAVAWGNFGFDLAKEIAGETGKLFAEGFLGGTGGQPAPCKDSQYKRSASR